MKIEKPENSNYCATVVAIQNIIPLVNCDNVVATTIFGFQCIVSKSTQIGDVGIFFPAETQLSPEYSSLNNLYRHEEYNKDHLKKGYLEDNRRVKAIKFRSHVSNGLFMPLESVQEWLKGSDKLSIGNEFDKLNGIEICKKYTIPVTTRGNTNTPPKPRRVEALFFPEHFSTDNYFKNDRNIAPDQEIIVTQKLHGTSIRIAHTKVNRKLPLKDKLARFFGVQVQPTEYAYIFGSRKVVKDPNNPDQQHYYETDIWTSEGKRLEGLIPENFLVFGELIGWTADNKPIQAGYTYCLPVGTCRLYVYRVAFVNEKGLVTDLTWEQIKEFCLVRNIDVVRELWRGKHKLFNATSFLDTRFVDSYTQSVPVEPGTVDEGVCIRVDALTPKIYKAKSPKFFEHETKLLDKGEVDLETTA